MLSWHCSAQGLLHEPECMQCSYRIAWLWATYLMTAHAPSKHSKSVLVHSKSVLDCMWENTRSQCCSFEVST
jgi:hypothetical protein